MRVLFLTRKYPPVTGGMERYSKELFEALSPRVELSLLANRRGNRFLPFFLLRAAIELLFRGRRFDLIHFGDGLLAVLLPFARLGSGAALTFTVHGLDLTYGNPLYRALALPRLRRADRIVAISENTARLAREAGIEPERIVVIPNGSALPASGGAEPRRPPALPARPATLICSLGRLVARKGQAWFVREVMPLLGPDYLYAIAGEGPERGAIEAAVAEKGLGGRVILLGRVEEEEREWLLRNAERFVMPNVPVKGDVEGFGLVLAEAATRGLYSVASRLDGIPDAVIPGETGSLVEAGNAQAFARALREPAPERARVASAARAFGWDAAAGRYVDMMRESLRRRARGAGKEAR